MGDVLGAWETESQALALRRFEIHCMGTKETAVCRSVQPISAPQTSHACQRPAQFDASVIFHADTSQFYEVTLHPLSIYMPFCGGDCVTSVSRIQ
jgi:hypothetical protein